MAGERPGEGVEFERGREDVDEEDGGRERAEDEDEESEDEKVVGGMMAVEMIEYEGRSSAASIALSTTSQPSRRCE